MSKPILNVITPTLKKVLENNPVPNNIEELSNFIVHSMKECERIARKDHNMSANQLGRCNGDWFEYLFEKSVISQIGKENIKVYPGRGHHIKEINGFEKVDWIPLPDAIIKDVNDFRGIISLKWGMRHDRMYEAAYEAFAIKYWVAKNKLPKVKVFLFTNDNFSGYKARLKIMANVPALDGVFYLEHSKLSEDLKKKIKSFSELIIELQALSS